MGEKERKVKDENYYSIFGWMTNPKRLGLTGLELKLYAIIFASSQGERDCFFGSIQYLSEFTGSSERGVQKALKNLVDKGYLIKKQKAYNQFEYIAVIDINKNDELSSPHDELSSPHDELSSPHMTNLVRHDDELSSPNNKDKLKGNIISIKKTKKQNKLEIEISNPKVREAFNDYMDMRKLLNKPMTQRAVNQAIKKLEKLAPDDAEKQIEIIDNSVNHCWLSFYPLKDIKTSSSSGAKKTQFNNFSQRDQDLSELEKKMLGG